MCVWEPGLASAVACGTCGVAEAEGGGGVELDHVLFLGSPPLASAETAEGSPVPLDNPISH